MSLQMRDIKDYSWSDIATRLISKDRELEILEDAVRRLLVAWQRVGEGGLSEAVQSLKEAVEWPT